MKIFKFIVVMVVVVFGICGVDAFAQAMQSGPSPLSTVLNESGRYTYSSRMKALVGMGDSLSVADCDALIGFLHRKAAEDVLDAGDLNTLKNDIANLLRKQPPVRGKLAESLIRISGDPQYNDTWRDFCIQHLGLLYGQCGKAMKQAIAQTLFEAVSQRVNSTVGTALIALHRGIDDEYIVSQAVSEQAEHVVTSSRYSPEARVTAIQIAAQLNNQRVLHFVRTMIAEENISAHLKMSGLAALGIMGDAQDVPQLEMYAAHDDIRLRTAARAALERLQ